jgi:hypothetical protein
MFKKKEVKKCVGAQQSMPIYIVSNIDLDSIVSNRVTLYQ